MAQIAIATYCPSRVTREDGAHLRHAIEAHWNDAEPLLLDFSDVRVASVSFFDESFGLLAPRHPLTELARRVKVENVDPADRKLLNSIVLSRSKQRETQDPGG